MDCERIENLLPFLADLDAGDADAVAARAHLAGCERCATLAEELRASLELVREFSEPDAGAEFYAAIRRDVLERVAAERPARRWARPLAIAASVALAALALALAVFALRDRPEGPKPLVVNEPGGVAPSLPAPEEAPERIGEPGEQPPSPAAYRPRQRARRHAAEQRAAVEPPATSGEMLRIEYQTSDPTVRIIWFVPKGDGASPETAKSGD